MPKTRFLGWLCSSANKGKTAHNKTFFGDSISLHISDYPRIYSGDQAVPELRDLPALCLLDDEIKDMSRYTQSPQQFSELLLLGTLVAVPCNRFYFTHIASYKDA